ncbi:MarR family transcriptional regulator [Niabella ginsenosidivorans]|uniref:MarR family transcriptional regulator n=1 Tax=Niabella ginsenosidivorans TaxID=1176587 RepID=A0A1A9I2H9_9BACT|nr:helix-turn-helix domain-containing protein [Niabella ginsenosidivorans]ANH81867.1 MarR family transcriptional regulator [Niabella ginsenosidivorans]
MNTIDEAGILALATRLQRLSEKIRAQGTAIYNACGISFDPKWFPVIYALHKKGVLSVVELAQEIGYTHPSTISLLKELTRNKLVRSKKDPGDDRRRLLYLSSAGLTLVDHMKPVWNLIIQAITKVTDTKNNLFKAIEEVEERVNRSEILTIALSLPRAKESVGKSA